MFKIRLDGYVPRFSIVRFFTRIPVTIFKVYIPRCMDCKNANEYVPVYGYPFLDPRCSVHHKQVNSNDIVCSDFKLMGRLCR